MRTITSIIILPPLLFLSLAWISEDQEKLIKFSHILHVKDNGVECSVCHYSAAGSKLSSDNLIGDHESCKSCHDEQGANNCNFCHFDPDNIEPIENPKRDIIFSHAQHTIKSIDCNTCHCGLDEVKYATPANMPVMGNCIQCHEKKNVSKECGTCHTNFTGLIPKDHREGNFIKDHKHQTRIGSMHVRCSMCHNESYCQNCHAGIELQRFGGNKDLMADPSTQIQLKDSPNEMKLQQVHNLNYRYTHGIDAKSRKADCYVCHEQTTFCVECHQSGGNINQLKIKPMNHNMAGFKLFTKGSGGGRHAQLAKRDIEYCVSCHDVEGADPTCMMCHSENGGIR